MTPDGRPAAAAPRGTAAGTVSDRATLLRLAVLWLAGIDMRVTLLAVPPVLTLIHRDLRLSETGVGVLTSLPVLLMAAAAVPGSLLIARAGARRAAIAGIMVVAISSGLRGAGPSVAMLFAMTFVMGVGVAVTQPAVPSLVARWCADRVGLATAVYVNGLLVGETLSAALTLPLVLPLVRGAWPSTLAVWALVPLGTGVLMLALRSRLPDAAAGPTAPWRPEWRGALVWRLGLLLGGISTAYFGTNAFLPDYLHTVGQAGLIGPCLAALNAGQLPASLLALILAPRITGRRAPLLAVPVSAAASLAVFLIGPPALRVLGAGLIGFSAALGLVLALALPPLTVQSRDVHRLSAGMFAVGYGYSFLLPLLGGMVWDLSHVPVSAFLPAFAGAATAFAAASALPPRAGLASGGS